MSKTSFLMVKELLKIPLLRLWKICRVRKINTRMRMTLTLALMMVTIRQATSGTHLKIEQIMK